MRFWHKFAQQRDAYVRQWESRMGVDAARSIYLARVLLGTGGWLVIGFNLAGLAAPMTGAAPLTYLAFGMVFFVACPTMLSSIFPLRRGTALIKERHGFEGYSKTTPLRFSAFVRAELFDAWVLENRRASPRIPLDGAPNG